MTIDQFKAAVNKLPLFQPIFDDSTYDETSGRIHAHRFKDGVWRYITRAELSAQCVLELKTTGDLPNSIPAQALAA